MGGDMETLDETESLERAAADVEMIRSAFPDETSSSLTDDNDTTPRFPLRLTLYLNNNRSDNINHLATNPSCIELEFRIGYPMKMGVEICTSRCAKWEEKRAMEAALQAIRTTSIDCREQEMEGGLACCAAALQAWQEAMEEVQDDQQQQQQSTQHNHDELSAMDTGGGGGGDAESSSCCSPQLYTDNNQQQQQQQQSNNKDQEYKWISGPPFIEKKSTFVAHVCRVLSEQQVHQALAQLKTSSSKIQRATHNMYAYRLREEQKIYDGTDDGHTTNTCSILKYDNDDDGEDAAGSKLAHLLELRGEENVVIMVSRWYGGIQLGPKRFAIISNVARELLVQCHETEWGNNNHNNNYHNNNNNNRKSQGNHTHKKKNK